MILIILVTSLPFLYPDRLPMNSTNGIVTGRVFLEENENNDRYHTNNIQNMNKVKDFILTNTPKSIKITSIHSLNNDITISFSSFDGYFSYEGEIELNLQKDYAFLLGGYSVKCDRFFPSYFAKFYSLNTKLIKKQEEMFESEIEKYIDFISYNIGSLSPLP